MLPLFTFPLAFAALAAVPALLAIYSLRNRFRRRSVSSLMLWVDHRQAREGGARVRRLQFPLFLLLELLILLLLIVAASDPRLLIGRASRPLMIVLDDSYSMLAGAPDSARSRGLEAVRETLQRHWGSTTHLVLAGPAPQTTGQPGRSVRRTLDQLEQWRCRSPWADLEKAIAFAGELGGPEAPILVITDHPPPSVLAEGRTRWHAVGQPRENLAIVNAVRSPGPSGERCLLEIANLSAEPAIARLTISMGPAGTRRSSHQLGPGEARRITFDLPPGAGVLHGRLGEDALDVDNHIALLPAPHRPVQVAVRVGDEELRGAIDEALASTGRARTDSVRTELLITDDPQTAAPPGVWSLVLRRDPEPASFIGPFVLDRAHPLTAGLSLAGVVWGAGQQAQPPGLPVVTVGDTALLTDDRRIGGSHELSLRLEPQLSTLHHTPNWPILFWNLLDWRAEHLPGVRRPNLRLGAEAVFTLHEDADEARIIDPDGRSYTLPVRDRRITFHPRAVGICQVNVNQTTYRLAVNALSIDESDLSDCRADTWGDWLDERTLRREYRSIAWALLLAAGAGLAAHQWLIARAAASVASPDGSAGPGTGGRV